MISLIISSKDKKTREEYIQNYCAQQSISQFDMTFIKKETALKQNLTSIGIEEIKNMQKKLYLKPIKSRIKSVIIEEAHLLTIEAQTALLKILEEPPPNTIIILSTESTQQLLPTIISRCKIVQLKKDHEEKDEKETAELIQFINQLPGMTISEKFKKAEALSKDKAKTIQWIEKLILALHKTLHSQNTLSDKKLSQTTVQKIISLQNLHTILKTTNANPRFALENTLLSDS
jgi:DNA polymerase III delta prime subunit